MALIALVTIGIDWIGKPLKHRRFIPRMYRFEDEKLPVDQYGNTDFGQALPSHLPMGAPFVPPMSMAPPPMMPAGPPLVAPPAPALAGSDHAAAPKPRPRKAQPAPKQVARLDPSVRSTSAFSDSLREDTGSSDAPIADADPVESLLDAYQARSTIAGTTADPNPAEALTAWSPGYPLDAHSEGRKPTLAVKAERFWQTIAADAIDTHFTEADIARMSSGKAPRRSNPRSGREEAMQLTGLRRASDAADVKMHWPEDAVDPWASA